MTAAGVAAISDAVLGRWFTPDFAAREPATISAMKAMMERTPAAGYAACCAAIRDMDQREAVAAIKAPTLVIAGTHDAATPAADGRFLAEHISHFTIRRNCRRSPRLHRIRVRVQRGRSSTSCATERRAPWTSVIATKQA